MNRYETILTLPIGAPMPFIQVAEMFFNFVKECEAEGMHPQRCPAIMLLGQQIAFYCHADIPAENMSQRLYERCVEQAEQRRAALQAAH